MYNNFADNINCYLVHFKVYTVKNNVTLLKSKCARNLIKKKIYSGFSIDYLIYKGNIIFRSEDVGRKLYLFVEQPETRPTLTGRLQVDSDFVFLKNNVFFNY